MHLGLEFVAPEVTPFLCMLMYCLDGECHYTSKQYRISPHTLPVSKFYASLLLKAIRQTRHVLMAMIFLTLSC